MNTAATQALRQVEELIGTSSFRTAAEKLGLIDINALTENEIALYWTLSAEVSLYLQDYDVGDPLDKAESYFRRVNDYKSLAKIKFLKGWQLVSLGQYKEAKEIFTESYVYYKQCNLVSPLARVLNRLSYIAFKVGDIRSAVNHLKKCKELYEGIDNIDNATIISINLGSLYYSLGDISKSIAIFEEVDNRLLEKTSRAINLYLNWAIPYALKCEFGRAKFYLEKSLPFIKDLNREKAIYYENLGWVQLLEGDFRNAEKSLLKGLKISLDIAPESALVPQITRRLADAYLGLQKYDLAKRYADEALSVAEKISERVEIAACYRIYAQLENISRNRKKARKWFKKAIDLFIMIGSQCELAVTRYLAAASGAYQNGERQALLYLAREYFEQEKIVPYIDKATEEIERTYAMPMPKPAGHASEAPVIIGASKTMKRKLELARHVAPSDMCVLLTGPTGSGKDLFARYIHHFSGRDGRFIPVNAAAIPDNMIESELFGYRKGAFTSADRTTTGWIEEAEGGTLYLNEIADASLELQAKLLDVIETGTIYRLGERKGRNVDFRLIAATNRNVEDLIRTNRFRLDLYHRLNEISIELPPLDERKDDIEALLRHFLDLLGITVTPDQERDFRSIIKAFSNRSWPGNVRQLQIEIKRQVLLTRGNLSRIAQFASAYEPSEKEELARLLDETGWNRREVARILGINESTVRKRIKKYGYHPPEE